MEEAGRGRWKKFTAEAGRSSPRWVEEVERGTHVAENFDVLAAVLYKILNTVAFVSGRELFAPFYVRPIMYLM